MVNSAVFKPATKDSGHQNRLESFKKTGMQIFGSTADKPNQEFWDGVQECILYEPFQMIQMINQVRGNLT